MFNVSKLGSCVPLMASFGFLVSWFETIQTNGFDRPVILSYWFVQTKAPETKEAVKREHWGGQEINLILLLLFKH